MPQPKPWFVIFRLEDANLPGSPWLRHGRPPRGKISAGPTGAMGVVALVGFILLLVAGELGIWLGLFLPGFVGLVPAIVATLVYSAAVITGFILVVRARSARWTPELAARLAAERGQPPR